MNKTIVQSRSNEEKKHISGGRRINFSCDGCNQFSIVTTYHAGTKTWKILCELSCFEHGQIVDGLIAPCIGSWKANMVR